METIYSFLQRYLTFLRTSQYFLEISFDLSSRHLSGGTLSGFLMGYYDEEDDKWLTVTKINKMIVNICLQKFLAIIDISV